jgi:hypothetical protein
VVMDASKEVTATYAEARPGLTVQLSGDGAGRVYDFTVDVPGSGGPYINCGGTNSDCNEESYWQVGNAVTLYAEPASGNVFAGWEGCATVAAGKGLPNGRCDFQIAASTVISARFLVDRPAPVINEFSASPAQVAPLGTPVVLSWDIAYSGTDFSLEITDNEGTTYDTTGKGLTDSLAVGSFNAARTFTLTVTTEFFGEDTAQDSIAVGDGPRILNFTVGDTTITSAAETTLDWEVENADTVTLTTGTGAPETVPANPASPRTVGPDVTTQYTLTATKAGFEPVSETRTITVGSAPVFTTQLSASETEITVGEETILSWVVTGASTLTLEKDPATGPTTTETVTGTQKSESPTITTTYTIIAINDFGTTRSDSVPVSVTALPLPTIGSFTATPTELPPGGGSVTLEWSGVTNATTLTVQRDNGPDIDVTGDPNNSIDVTQTATTTYTLVAENATGPTTFTPSRTVTVAALEAPVVELSASPNPSPSPGSTVTLSWTLSGGAPSSLVVNPGNINVIGEADNAIEVTPAVTTPYTITATNAADSDEDSVTVTVTPAAVLPDATLTLTEPADVTGDYTLTWAATAGTPPITFSLSDGTTSTDVTNLGGTTTVDPSVTTTYTLTASNSAGSDPTPPSVTITAPTVVLTADPTSTTGTESVALDWSGSTGTGPYTFTLNTSIDGGTTFTPEPVSGTETTRTPTVDTIYTVTMTTPVGTITSSRVTVTVTPPIQAPSIRSFNANPTEISEGGSSTLAWEVIGDQPLTVSIDGIGEVGAVDTLPVSPNTTTPYTLRASNPADEVFNTITVTVIPPRPEPATIANFSASPTTIDPGGTSTLSWTVSGTEPITVTISDGASDIFSNTGNGSGTLPVTPSATMTYTLSASNGVNPDPAPRTAQVTVNPPAAPVINSFEASPGEILTGESSTLTWDVSGEGLSVEIDNAVGAVSPQGSTSVSPPDDTTYTLTASNGGGTRTATATIVVNDPPTPPVINSFTANPTEIVAGSSSTLEWEVVGSEPLAVSLDNGIGEVEAVSSLEVSPDTTTSYTLTASNTAGNVSNTVTLTVTIPDEPASVVSFAAEPATIELGDSSTLTWSATGTPPLEISLFENGVLLQDGLDVSGSFPVTPTSEGNYSYTLTAGNEAGSDSAESEVTVLLPDDGGDDEDEG